jgi:hypothetical protein
MSSGFLPAVRPTRTSYGPEYQDDHPVDDPERQLAAQIFNDVKSDVAFCGAVVPLAIIRVRGGTTPVVEATLGIPIANVKWYDGDDSFTTLAIAGVAIYFAHAHSHSPPVQVTSTSIGAGSNVVTVYHAGYCDFSLFVY